MELLGVALNSSTRRVKFYRIDKGFKEAGAIPLTASISFFKSFFNPNIALNQNNNPKTDSSLKKGQL